MNSKEIFIAGLITADHIMLKNGNNWQYLGSIGGGSAANVYFALKSYNVPVRLIGAVGNKNKNSLKISLKDINSDPKNIIYISENSETREYYHLIKKKNNHWRHEFSSISPITDQKQSYSVQFRKSFFIKDIKKVIKNCLFFYMDRISKGLLEIAQLAYDKNIPLIFDFGTISTRYFKEKMVKNAIKNAKIIQIPQKIFNYLKKNLDFKTFQELNPNILIWIVTAGNNPIKAYHKNIGEIELEISQVNNILDAGGAGDGFMSMLIKQYYDLYKNKKSIENLTKKEFILFLNNCVINARKACQFIGSRTYIYDFLEYLKKSNNIEEYLSKPLENIIYYERSLNLLETYGKEIQHISDNIYSHENHENIHSKKGKGIFESNLLNIPSFVSYALNKFESYLKSYEIADLGSTLIAIGSGASFSVAKTLQQIYAPPSNELSVYALTPYEYILKVDESYPVFIISYSGTNPDIKSCYKKAIKNNSKLIFFLTGNKNSLLYNKIQKMNNGIILPVITPKKEQGFVGIYSMIASICIAARFFNQNHWKYDYLKFFSKENLEKTINKYIKKLSKEFKQKLKEYNNKSKKLHIIALGTNWSEPVLIDMESKIIECNLGTIEISELKNYTHGRYINLFKNPENRIVVIFETPETRILTEFLERRLSKISPVFKMKAESDDFIGMINLFFQMLVFINELGKYYNQDPSKPGFPVEAKGLYDWNGLY